MFTESPIVGSLNNVFGTVTTESTYLAHFTIALGIILIINTAVMLWCNNDSLARSGKKCRRICLAIMFVFGPLTLPVHFISRKSGKLTRCLHCGREKLREDPVCPHCNAAAVIGRYRTVRYRYA